MSKTNRGPSRRLVSRKQDQKGRLNRTFTVLKFAVGIVKTVLSIFNIWSNF